MNLMKEKSAITCKWRLRTWSSGVVRERIWEMTEVRKDLSTMPDVLYYFSLSFPFFRDGVGVEFIFPLLIMLPMEMTFTA